MGELGALYTAFSTQLQDHVTATAENVVRRELAEVGLTATVEVRVTLSDVSMGVPKRTARNSIATPNGRRPGPLRRAVLLTVTEPMDVDTILAALHARGVDATKVALHQMLLRLAGAGELVRVHRGVYGPGQSASPRLPTSFVGNHSGTA